MIPRILHFVWIDEAIPPERQACIDTCTALHPMYEVRIWTSAAEFGPLKNQELFSEAAQVAPEPPTGNPWQIRSNVLRFEILERFGGVYLDSDVFCLKPLDALLERTERLGKSGMLGWEIQERWLGEAIVACEQGAPFMAKIVDELQPWAFARKRKPATVTVGPQAITPILRGSPELDDVLVVPERVFYPARHNEPERGDAIVSGAQRSPDTLAVHMFANFRRKRALKT